MLTRYIKDAISEGYSAEFVRMLENYGRWSHYLGVSGYRTGKTDNEAYDIDDDSAMILDTVIQRIKTTHRAMFYIFMMVYIQNMSYRSVIAVFKQNTTKRLKEIFELDEDSVRAMKYLTVFQAKEIVIKVEKEILRILQEDY